MLNFNHTIGLYHCIVLYCIVSYYIVLYCIVLYCIVLYCITLPAQPQGTVSYSFLSPLPFLLSFILYGNTSFSHTSLHSVLTKLGHSDRYLDHYSCTNNNGVRGQDGVTGVKKVIFTKKASSPTEYLALMRDLCICITLIPSKKVMVLKIHPGSFGVTGGQKGHFHQKRHQVLQNCIVLYCIVLYCIVLPCRRSRRVLFLTRFFPLSLSSFFFHSFWQHVFFTYFPTFDFDLTSSQ